MRKVKYTLLVILDEGLPAPSREAIIDALSLGMESAPPDEGFGAIEDYTVFGPTPLVPWWRRLW